MRSLWYLFIRNWRPQLDGAVRRAAKQLLPPSVVREPPDRVCVPREADGQDRRVKAVVRVDVGGGHGPHADGAVDAAGEEVVA